MSDQAPLEDRGQPASGMPAEGEGDADISALATPEQLALELGREAVRIRREERKGLGAYWRGSLVLLGLMVFIAIASTAVLAIGLIGDARLVLPALGVLTGSGGGGVFLWRLHAQRFRVD